ncbi:hypothetical protein OE88DRAFT_1730887 [Heliocybe sulcata]|uniref:Uncharacterized protein n=1 Tax=Heliocybe sulcata TaxID=5364 RepID=A0A5C3NIJ8_9AGAM|nr:hypothetical protein OE88DRAFT_1730887 [Heliocybe sulcata]
MPLRPSTEPAFTLVLNNRDYSPPSRAYFREIWYPPSPEPFSKFDPLMRTVDIRDIDSWSWRSDLCVPALSDISEEEVQDGTVMIPDEVMESLSVKKRPRILLALEVEVPQITSAEESTAAVYQDLEGQFAGSIYVIYILKMAERPRSRPPGDAVV